jgi:hypothetical protein
VIVRVVDIHDIGGTVNHQVGLKRSLHNLPENIEFQLKSFMNSNIRSI